MFQTLASPSKGRANSIIGSLLLHVIVLTLCLYRPPIFVKPSSVAWGQHGRSEALVYTPQAQFERQPVPKKLLVLLKAKHKPLPEIAKAAVELPRAGTPVGSLYHGPGSGSEAKPALPMVFPDPTIFPWQLNGLQGDVIVEVTIDEQGSVTQTKILQSLKDEIDEKVVTTLKNWRFRPATVDGVAISSRQDVHFHFPS
jgi:TonB family protein